MDRKRQTLSCHCLPEQAGLVAVCLTRKYCSFYIIINCYWRHGCLVEMAGYWQTYFVEVFMDLNCVPVHKHAKKKEPSQYLAILMSGLVISPENLIDYYLGSSFLTQLRDFASDKKKNRVDWLMEIPQIAINFETMSQWKFLCRFVNVRNWRFICKTSTEWQVCCQSPWIKFYA